MPPVHNVDDQSPVKPKYRVKKYPVYNSDDVDYDMNGNPQPVECPPGMIDMRFGRERFYPIDKPFVRATVGKHRMTFDSTSAPHSIHSYLQHYKIKYGYSMSDNKCKVNIPAPWNLRMMCFGRMGYAPQLAGRWIELNHFVTNAIATAMELETSQYIPMPFYSDARGEFINVNKFVPTKIDSKTIQNHLFQMIVSSPFNESHLEN